MIGTEKLEKKKEIHNLKQTLETKTKVIANQQKVIEDQESLISKNQDEKIIIGEIEINLKEANNEIKRLVEYTNEKNKLIVDLNDKLKTNKLYVNSLNEEI